MKRGCHGLLREGAGLAEHVEDIFAALGQFGTSPGLPLRRPLRNPKISTDLTNRKKSCLII